MSQLYFVKCRTHAAVMSAIEAVLFPSKSGRSTYESHGILNFRQATSQELLKLSIFCAYIYASIYFHHQSINGINQHTLLASYEFAENGIGCIAHMSHFLVATASYTILKVHKGLID